MRALLPLPLVLVVVAVVASTGAYSHAMDGGAFDIDQTGTVDIHPAVFAQLELGLESGRSRSHSRLSRTEDEVRASHTARRRAHAHGTKKGPHITVINNNNELNTSGDDDDDGYGRGPALTPAAPSTPQPATTVVEDADNGNEQKQKAADEARQKEEKRLRDKKAEESSKEELQKQADRVPNAQEIQAAVKPLTIKKEWVGCHRRVGGCDTTAGPWGMGRSFGREYMDRLGGFVAKISDCPGDYVVRGIGVARCGEQFGMLQLVYTCCRLDVKLV